MLMKAWYDNGENAGLEVKIFEFCFLPTTCQWPEIRLFILFLKEPFKIY